ncbi:hypothetical protein [Lysobacter gummosus]|uniref:hypothetical protein n=1 Tax=Lysobacter gummosus TaxID=262324 RepID=UPI003626B86D
MQRPLATGIDDQAGRSRHSRPRPERDLGRRHVRRNGSDLPVHAGPGSILGAPATPVTTACTRRTPASPAGRQRRPPPASPAQPRPERGLPAEAQCRQALVLWLTGGIVKPCSHRHHAIHSHFDRRLRHRKRNTGPAGPTLHLAGRDSGCSAPPVGPAIAHHEDEGPNS